MRISERLQQKHFQLLVIVAVFIVILITLVATSNNQQILSHTTRASSPQTIPTLTRIGSDLNFDYSSCPPSSVMLNSTQLNTVPLHNDCPRVFIIGARKGGTTSMYQYLSSHPDFGGVRLDKGPSAGETFYFSLHYNKKPWSEYVSEFPADKMSGDSSVGNLVDCRVPQRLYSNCGRTAKVVVLLRNPLERFQSNFRMRARLKTRYNTHMNISDIVEDEINRFYHRVSSNRNINMDHLSGHPNNLTCTCGPAGNMVFEGLYYVHLHNWLCNFPAENILILNTEQMHDNSVKSLAEAMKFVGLQPLEDHMMQQVTSVVYNNGGKLENELSFRKLTMSDKKKLLTIYESFNNKLFQLLQWNTVKWNELIIN
ncbi:heparan sulfate glucosamine 3-O-sulfotransferase 1-like [Dysidea avara]|uniref:heparan sulfate glucosamine 3-O-sulfotransferase 1-like n=1 Tax=Dysidea avara TaxID=196820 RepID=UPI00332562B3